MLLGKSPKIASWPGILVSHKGTRIKVVLVRKLGKQGHGPVSGRLGVASRPFSSFPPLLRFIGGITILLLLTE